MQRLLKLAYERGPEAKLPTHRDLCASLKVSPFLMNAALETLETQNVIRRRQGSGIYVSPDLGRKHIGIVLDAEFTRDASPFWGLLQRECILLGQRQTQEAAEEYHFYVTVPSPRNPCSLPPDVLRRIQEGALHGILGIGLDFSVETAPAEHGIPTVVMFGHGDWSIGFSGEAVDREGIRALAARGCRRIAYWGQIFIEDGSSAPIDRVKDFFVQTLAEEGLPFFPELFRMLPTRGVHYSQAAGAEMARAALAAGAPPFDGVVIGNDIVAQGALAAMRDLGVLAGRDVQTAAFANAGSISLYGYEDRIIRVEVDPAALAAAAVETMGRVLSGDPPAEREISLPLTVREPTQFE